VEVINEGNTICWPVYQPGVISCKWHHIWADIWFPNDDSFLFNAAVSYGRTFLY